jgi:phytoene dehydrogenase-like protein
VTETVDVVVAGAGHNSLIAAAYLARAGYEVRVLEERPVAGGNTATEELTGPGFLHDSCSTAHVLIQASPTLRDDELGLLSDYGLEYLHPDPVVVIPFPDGRSITQWRDLDRTCDELARFSVRDADAYRRLIADYDAVRTVFGRERYLPAGEGAPEPGALPARWLRRRAESAWEVVEREFEEPHVRAFLLWMAMQTIQPPDRPGTGPLASSLVYGRQTQSWVVPRGGSGALPAALERCIADHGGSVLTGRRVSELVLERGRCVGVRTADGEEHRARRGVLSTIHVKHLVDMAPAGAWGPDFLEGVAAFRPGMTLFAAYYATTEPPLFMTEDGPRASVAAGTPTSVERLLRVGSDFAAGRVALDDPWLLVVCATVADPSRAPEGRHTLKVLGLQPYEAGDWDERKDEVAAAHLAQLRRYAPNLTDDKIIASAIHSPLDLERFNAHNWRGTCHGGDLSPAQSGALRPVAGWAQHRMPIPGLYQTGATTHPGGSVSGAPGRNAALVMLRDLGTSIEEVVAGAGRARAGRD